MKQIALFLVFLFILSCSNENSYKDVGDIAFDQAMDDENFKLCNERNIKQYYVRWSSDVPAGYKGEKRTFEEIIWKKYEYPVSKEQNGYVTIRFIVNCEGKSGRFRIEAMDFDYQPFQFDAKITEQLLEAVKGLNDWIPVRRKEKSYDFYQYLTFKIKDGQIIKVLP